MKEQATYPWYLVPTILSSTASSVVQWPLATTRCAGGGEWLLALLSSSCLGDSPGGGVGGEGGGLMRTGQGESPGFPSGPLRRGQRVKPGFPPAPVQDACPGLRSPLPPWHPKAICSYFCACPAASLP